jgi:hypothetical protein
LNLRKSSNSMAPLKAQHVKAITEVESKIFSYLYKYGKTLRKWTHHCLNRSLFPEEFWETKRGFEVAAITKEDLDVTKAETTNNFSLTSWNEFG